jgi:hypothetical protein
MPPSHTSHFDAEAVLTLDHKTPASGPLSWTVKVPSPPLHELPDLFAPTEICVGIPSARPLRQRKTLFGTLAEPCGALVLGCDHNTIEVRVGVLQCEQIGIWEERDDRILDFSWKEEQGSFGGLKVVLRTIG